MIPDPDRNADVLGLLGKIYAMFVCGLLAAIAIISIVEQLGASAPSLIAGFAGVVLSAFAALAWGMRSGSMRDHLLAGRCVPPVYAGLAAATSWTGFAIFTGLTGIAYTNGFDGLALLIGLSGGLVLSLIAIAPYLTRAGAVTVPDFFGTRFGRLARCLVCLLVIGCAGCLLVVYIRIGSLITAQSFAMPLEAAIGATSVALLVLSLPGGRKSVTWVQVAQGILVLGALLVPIAIVCWWTFGVPVPHIAYGAALTSITSVEEQMVEKGLVDFNIFQPHLNPFLQIDQVNFCTLVLCLMTGTAAMPHGLAHAQSTSSAPSARLSSAWAVVFAVLLLTAAPAYAAIVKLNVYSLVARQSSLADLPPWVARASAADAVRLYGVSTAMLGDGAHTIAAGAARGVTIGTHLSTNSTHLAQDWSQLPEPVQAAMRDVAKKGSALTADQTWALFKQSILPVAALAAGNDTGSLALAGISVDPHRLILAVTEIAGMPAVVTAVVVAGALAAALAGALGLLVTITSTLTHDVYAGHFDRTAKDPRRVLVMRLLTVLVAGAAGGMALIYKGDVTDLVVASFTITAAGLFPALVAGIWWPRANAWGVVSGLLAGLGIAVYYLVGTSTYAISFADTWGTLSSASPEALAEFADLKAAWLAAEGDARSVALTDLQSRASGTLFSPGLANWLGIARGSAAVFSIPASFLVTILVSLLTPGPDEKSRKLARAMHDARHDPVLPFDDAGEGAT